MKRSGKFYRKNEKEVMRKLGIVPTKGSGAGWIEKEDGQNDFIIAQLKSTDAESMKVNKRDIDTLEYNANISHKVPIFVIQFLKTDEVYILVRPTDLDSISEYLETGKCEISKNDLVDFETVNAPEPKNKVKSGNRNDFWKNKEKEYLEWQKQLKSKQ